MSIADFSHFRDLIKQPTRIWSAFIPPTSSASFHQGGYFSTEIIPDAVAAISVNTLYFYTKNHGK
jgi:endopolyphosphatase